MSLVEVLLFLRAPGGPFERSSIDALVELAGALRQVPFARGHVFWREGEPARRVGFIVAGSVACAVSRGPEPCLWRVEPGRFLGLLEAAAREPRWYDAVAETAGIALEHDVDGWADVLEDNVAIAIDCLAWVSRTTLALLERESEQGRELFEFFTTLATPQPSPSGFHDDVANERGFGSRK
jgi:CRP-like cAMP-binding protein